MKMHLLRKSFTIFILSAAVLSAMTPAGVRASFTIGNLAVEQLATNATSSQFSIVELKPYATNSSPVNIIVIPTNGTSALRQSSAGTDGRLALTQDRALLAFTGAEDGTGVSDETTILPRGVGTVDANGKYLLQASYTGTSGNQARSATSLDDKTWYFGDKGGIYTNGLSTSLNSTNVGSLRSFGGTVYAVSTKALSVVSSVSASGKSLTSLPGLPADANATDFYMVASGNNGSTNDVLYVSDGAKAVKYSLVGGSWVNNGTNALGVTADGLCAINNGSGAFLYVTTGTGGSVVKLTDTAGYNAAPAINTNNNVTLYTGASYLKGIDFAPVPNLAVEQLQQNTSSSQFSIVELNPYSTNSSPVNTIVIPTHGPNALRQANSGSTGRLALTGDRTLLAFTGAQDGTGVADETTVNLRGVGTIDSSANGNFTLQTTYTGLGGSTKNQTRSATSLDNLTWYIGDKGGIYTNNTVNPINSTNIRPVKCFGGQVIACAATSGSATPSVLNTVSADATTLTPLPGLESTLDANALDFYMIASGVNGSTNDIAYVNDGTSVAKYSLVGGSWTANGSATLGVTADGICAINIGGGANLYVTTGTGGTVVEITDTTGYNVAPVITTTNNVTLYSGAPYLKGIDFAPVGGVTGGSSALTPPTLIPAVGATVDGPFTNTFTDDPNWRLNITNITVNSVTLSPSAYNTNNPGKIIFLPTASILLESSGSKSIVIGATGYSLDAVSQPLGAGAAKTLAITTQPAAPSGNGGTLVTQPVVVIADQYGNAATNTVTFTASVGSGTWSFGAGSSATQLVVNGTAAFTNLSATSGAAVSGATIIFTVSGSGLGGLASTTTNSSAFNIPALATTGFTPGNLAVLQEDLAAKNSTFSILELSTSTADQSSPVNTFPISATGPNALRMSSAATTGRLATSDDGTLVCFAAFEDGSSATADETTIDPRGVGTLGASGNFVLQTSYIGLGDATGNQARSATSVDNNFWYIGDKGGVYTNNANSPVIGGTGSNVRSLKSFGGTIYALQQFSSTLARPVLSTVVLTPDSQQLDDLAGLPEDADVSDFYMVRSGQNGSTYDTIYYIDGTNSTSGAIFKFYTTDGVNWISAGSAATVNGGDGLCAATNASGGVDLYYTTGNGGVAGNSLIKVTDAAAYNQSIALNTPQTLYTVGSQATLKGVAFAPMSPPTAPTVTTLTASNITASSATLNGTVNPNGAATAYWFEYGTNTSYNNFTATNTTSQAGLVSIPVSSLTQGTTYHYQLVATNGSGGNVGGDLSFGALAVIPFQLTAVGASGDGVFAMSFSNVPGASFSVLATNDLTIPVTNWPVIGQTVEGPAGFYQFTNFAPTNAVQFYRLRSN